MSPRFLRPPGARPGREFLSRCLHCGQCAAVCPFQSITLSVGFDPRESGTPKIFPDRKPCYLCLRCPPACPSGALTEVAIEEVRMGRARINRPNCFVWGGMVICRSCFENCPLKGKAIVLEKGIFPVITERCAGCGICEHVCPKKAIVTRPG